MMMLPFYKKGREGIDLTIYEYDQSSFATASLCVEAAETLKWLLWFGPLTWIRGFRGNGW